MKQFRFVVVPEMDEGGGGRSGGNRRREKGLAARNFPNCLPASSKAGTGREAWKKSWEQYAE